MLLKSHQVIDNYLLLLAAKVRGGSREASEKHGGLLQAYNSTCSHFNTVHISKSITAACPANINLWLPRDSSVAVP